MKTKFEDFKLNPPSHVWNALDQKLDKRRTKVRKLRWLGLAASLLPLTFATAYLFTDMNTGSNLLTAETNTSQSEFYDQYRDFIQSGAYKTMSKTYEALSD